MLLPKFPKSKRGSYTIVTDPEISEPDQLQEAKDNIRKIARREHLILLSKTFIRGKRWVIVWWPANEPRHDIEDEIVYDGQQFYFEEESDGATQA